MSDEEVKAALDEVYAVGFKNGQIEMKNKVLKKINRDWGLITIIRPIDLIVSVLKLVNKVPLSKPPKD